MTGKRNRGRIADAPFFRTISPPQAGEKRSERTRSHRMKFCVQKGLGESPTSSARSRMAILGHCLPRLSRNGITFFFSKKNKAGEEFVKFTHRLNSFQISRIVRLVLSWFPAYGARGFHAFLTGSCNTASSSDRLPRLPGKHPD